MRKYKIFITVFLFILLFIKPCSFAQNQFTSGNSKKLTGLILPNGLTLIIEERKDPPLVYLQLTVKTGSIYENEYLGTGISHFIEHMIFKGRELEKAGKFVQKVTAMGGEVNAYTSFDRTAYHILVPSSQWKEALDILLDAVFNPSFDEKEIEKERKVILREMALREDDPNRFLSMHFWKNFFNTHPYKFPVIGEKQLFMALKQDDLINYHQKRYVPNNMILAVCGDINKDEVKEHIIEKTNNLNPSALLPVVLPQEPPQLAERDFILEKDVKMDYLNIGFHIPPFGDEDMYALDVLSIILGTGKNSRLYKSLKTNEPLVYSISCYSFTPLYEGTFVISAIMKQENTGQVKRRIFEEIQKISLEGINDEELEEAKNKLKMQQLANQETLEGRAEELALNYMYTRDLDFTSKYLAKIDKVKKEEVAKVAYKYLTESNSTTGILTTPPPIEKNETESQEISKIPTKEVLENSLTLILRKNSQLPLVSVVAVMSGGVIIENEQNNGICDIFSSMLIKGTKNHTYEEIINSIESLGGNIGVFSGNNSFGIKINVHSKDTDIALDILADILLNSNFQEDELKKGKDTQIMQITKEKDDIFSYGFKNLRKQFFNTHPYSLSSSGEISTISSIKRDDLLRIKNKLLVGKNTVISISGDFDQEKIKKKIEYLFSSLPKGEKVEGGYPQILKNKKIDLEGKWNQSVLFMGFPAPSIKDNDFYVMEILSTYLNGQASPLFINLRDQKALAYSVGVFPLSGWDPGILVFYIATKKDKLEEVLKEMQTEIKNLKKGDFSESDIESAKKKLLTQKWGNLQDNQSFAFELALSELYGLGYEEPLQLKEKISDIKKDDLIQFTNKYLNEKKSTVLFLKGE